MALDSPELIERMAALALQHGVDRVILRPEAKRSWVYDKHGKLLQKDVSPFAVNQKGRRIMCRPVFDEGEGMWRCSVYTGSNVSLHDFDTQFPE
jgi:hypothetical protein